MSGVRVAVVQASASAVEAAIAKVREFTAMAGRQGASLALFPEAMVGGYPKGKDFGARVGQRSPEGRREFRRYFESAIEVPGPVCEALGEAAREAGLHLVTGVVERDGGTLYCTVLFFSPAGHLLGKHRKVMPTAMERLIWGFGDGSTLPVISTPLGRIGAVICWENYMPLLRAAMYAKGIQLYCAPTVDDRDTWAPSMRHIACEGRCFVLSACQYRPEPEAGAAIRGGSLIVDPLGKILAGPRFDEERILTADVDLDEIAEGKYDLDVTGPLRAARPVPTDGERTQGRTGGIRIGLYWLPGPAPNTRPRGNGSRMMFTGAGQPPTGNGNPRIAPLIVLKSPLILLAGIACTAANGLPSSRTACASAITGASFRASSSIASFVFCGSVSSATFAFSKSAERSRSCRQIASISTYRRPSAIGSSVSLAVQSAISACTCAIRCCFSKANRA